MMCEDKYKKRAALAHHPFHETDLVLSTYINVIAKQNANNINLLITFSVGTLGLNNR
jgi:hypothetical protein